MLQQPYEIFGCFGIFTTLPTSSSSSSSSFSSSYFLTGAIVRRRLHVGAKPRGSQPAVRPARPRVLVSPCALFASDYGPIWSDGADFQVSSEKAGHETAKIVYRTEHLDHIFMLGFVGVCVAVVVGTVTMHSIQLCRRERAIGRSIPMHIFFLLSILPYGGTTNPHQQQPHQHHLPIIPKKNNMWPYPPFLNFNILRFFCFLFSRNLFSSFSFLGNQGTLSFCRQAGKRFGIYTGWLPP